MGNENSTKRSPQVEKQLTNKPWRHPASWDTKLMHELLTKIKQLEPEKCANLLILGQVGVGKSSFVNSILSIDKGRKCSKAQTAAFSQKSWTLGLKKYTDRNILNRFRFYDAMGIDLNDGCGVHLKDLLYLIQGHIKQGYMFNPASPIREDNDLYRRKPTLEQKMHCIIFVVSATAIFLGIPEAYVRTIKGIQETLQLNDIPRIMILTKVDQICEEVKNDNANMFWSIKVREAVQKASAAFGIEEGSIHPVKNYVDEYTLNTETTIPLLLALRETMHCAVDKVETLCYEDSDVD